MYIPQIKEIVLKTNNLVDIVNRTDDYNLEIDYSIEILSKEISNFIDREFFGSRDVKTSYNRIIQISKFFNTEKVKERESITSADIKYLYTYSYARVDEESVWIMDVQVFDRIFSTRYEIFRIPVHLVILFKGTIIGNCIKWECETKKLKEHNFLVPWKGVN